MLDTSISSVLSDIGFRGAFLAILSSYQDKSSSTNLHIAREIAHSSGENPVSLSMSKCLDRRLMIASDSECSCPLKIMYGNCRVVGDCLVVSIAWNGKWHWNTSYSFIRVFELRIFDWIYTAEAVRKSQATSAVQKSIEQKTHSAYELSPCIHHTRAWVSRCDATLEAFVLARNTEDSKQPRHARTDPRVLFCIAMRVIVPKRFPQFSSHQIAQKFVQCNGPSLGHKIQSRRTCLVLDVVHPQPCLHLHWVWRNVWCAFVYRSGKHVQVYNILFMFNFSGWNVCKFVDNKAMSGPDQLRRDLHGDGSKHQPLPKFSTLQEFFARIFWQVCHWVRHFSYERIFSVW